MAKTTTVCIRTHVVVFVDRGSQDVSSKHPHDESSASLHTFSSQYFRASLLTGYLIGVVDFGVLIITHDDDCSLAVAAETHKQLDQAFSAIL